MEFTREQEIEIGNELELLDLTILHSGGNIKGDDLLKINNRRDEIRTYFTEKSKVLELDNQIKRNKFVDKFSKMSNKEKLEFYKQKLSKLDKKEKTEIKFTKQDIEKYEKLVEEEMVIVDVKKEVFIESKKEKEESDKEVLEVIEVNGKKVKIVVIDSKIKEKISNTFLKIECSGSLSSDEIWYIENDKIEPTLIVNREQYEFLKMNELK